MYIHKIHIYIYTCGVKHTLATYLHNFWEIQSMTSLLAYRLGHLAETPLMEMCPKLIYIYIHIFVRAFKKILTTIIFEIYLICWYYCYLFGHPSTTPQVFCCWGWTGLPKLRYLQQHWAEALNGLGAECLKRWALWEMNHHPKVFCPEVFLSIETVDVAHKWPDRMPVGPVGQ